MLLVPILVGTDSESVPNRFFTHMHTNNGYSFPSLYRDSARGQDLGESARARKNLVRGVARGCCLDEAGHVARGEPWRSRPWRARSGARSSCGRGTRSLHASRLGHGHSTLERAR
jgi:hypothetical protein